MISRTSVTNLLCSLALTLICSACAQLAEAPPPPPEEPPAEKTVPIPQPEEPSKAELEFKSGIASYENGSYKQASRQIQSALALGLPDSKSKAQAHKYLAFMHCVGGRKRKCREEFIKALDADSQFDLAPAEAGHPTWGPVFRKLKATRNVSSNKTAK
jgi:Tfp pilus assembly protein PilF